MSQALKIAIIGDYNFMYNSHQATNMALDHSGNFLELDISYYWIKISEAAQFKIQQFEQYDALLISPGPFQNIFFLNGILRTISSLSIPVLITGEGYRSLIEILINSYQLNPNGEKMVSENLVEGNNFERVQVIPHSKEFIQLYENHSNVELTASRFSLYPQLITALMHEIVDIEAYNQFEEPEVISLKKHPFFVACSYCPQISSTRDIPHPLIYTFMKIAAALSDEKASKIA